MDTPSNGAIAGLAGLRDDVRRVADFDWAVWDCGLQRFLFISGDERPEGANQVNGDGWVVQIWRRLPLLRNFHSISVDEVPLMVSEVADVVQTTVMDELNRGWPELVENGRFAGILRLEPGSDGQLWWSLRGAPLCVAGQLGKLPIA